MWLCLGGWGWRLGLAALCPTPGPLSTRPLPPAEAVEDSLADLLPHRVTEYLYDLSSEPCSGLVWALGGLQRMAGLCPRGLLAWGVVPAGRRR